MKKIEYKVDSDGICLTPCPYTEEVNGVESYHVGSGACYCCPFCVSQDSEQQILECKADEINNKTV